MNRLLKEPLCGIVTPLVTPLLDNDVLDVDGLERLIERLINGGVSAIFILGTTGEAQSLSYTLREKMIENTCHIVNGRIPVLVGITETSLVASKKLANFSANQGAEAVVSAPPYYFASAQPELCEFYLSLVKDLPLPLFLYNMPVHTKVSFAPSTIRRIAENPNVIGFKDSSANGAYFQSVMYEMRDRKDFSLLVGTEEMTGEMVLMGAHGGVNGGANIFPKLYVALYNAARNGDLAKLNELQQKVMQISSSIYTVGHHGSSYLKGLKCTLSLLGVCNDFLAAPFHHFEKPERDTVKRALDNLDLGEYR
jgi:dihydrodipicolinate synthase/N-acetylneuraminate lyase